MTSKTNLSLASTTTLRSGYTMPLLGYGLYQTPAADAQRVTAHALGAGYRHVDTARAYRNEKPTAAALVASGIPRHQSFYTTKVPPKAINYAAAKEAIADSLRDAEGLGYIDLLLLHSPYGGKEGRLGAWKACVEAVEEGSVRSIGVSNYGVHHLEELEGWIREREAAEGEGKGGVLSVHQVEVHPWLARRDIVSWCRERGVVVQAWAPLARTTKFHDEGLIGVAKKVGRSPAQVLIRWSLQKGLVPLPKSVTPSRIDENAQVYDFELDEADMQALETDEYSPSSWDPTVSRD